MKELLLVFFAECQEMLTDVEQHLSDLDAGTGDAETTNAIFRAIHSIKAGAGVFNFKALVTFSHVFEAFLDRLRNNEIEVTPDVVSLLFEGNDIVAAMVEAAETKKTLDKTFGGEVLDRLSSFTQETEEPAATGADASCQDDDDDDGFGLFADDMSDSEGFKTYSVDFKPNGDIFQRANEPLLLIRELMTLGPVSIDLQSQALPNLEDLDPETSYYRWILNVKTDAGLSAVKEVFEFVEDDCTLSIEEKAEETGQARSADASSHGPSPDPAQTDQDSPDRPVIPEKVAQALIQQAATEQPQTATPDAPANEQNTKATSIRVDLDRVDRLVNMVGELVITQAMLTQELQGLEKGVSARLLTGMEEMAAHARELQDNVMAVRMQPVKSVFSRMPRLVRDVARKLDKQVKLTTVGETTEVDKTVIEELADPLTHMIRNSLDHGLETPAEREAAGKPAQGNIWLRAEHRGGRIIIEIEDDGRGIRRDKVLEKAIDKGLIEPDHGLTDEEVDNLIFHPGFSTADAVTDLSGRGVGMDVVRRNILSLGGRISVSSVTGKGSKFTLALPLTLAVLDGMIVAVGDQKYVIPVNSITESIRPDAADVKTMVGGSLVVRVRGDYIPLVSVAAALEVQDAVQDPSKALVVIVETDGGAQIGLVVDALLGQQQVVIKSLETNYMRIDGISAATILGNGQVCLILDIDGLEAIEQQARSEGRNRPVIADAPAAVIAPTLTPKIPDMEEVQIHDQ